MKITDVLLFFASSIAFAIFLYWIIPLCKNKIYTYRHNARRKKLIADLMNRSMAQRSKFRLEVLDGDLKGSACEGVCSLAKNNKLSIEVIETFGAQQWKDCTCIIFFQIIQKKKTLFFYFSEKCIDARRRGDITNLDFEIPLQLESGQKRKSLRCVPPKDALLGLGLWALPPERPLPTSKGEIAKPMYAYRPKQNSGIALADVSAGGACMYIKPAGEEVVSSKLKAGTRILTLLMLNTTAIYKKNTALWISGHIISVDFSERDKIWRICLRFEAWATMNDSKNEIMWFPNDENGCIPTLSQLVLRWNMQINKAE